MATHEIPRNVKGERKNFNDIFHKIIDCKLHRSLSWIYNILFI